MQVQVIFRSDKTEARVGKAQWSEQLMLTASEASTSVYKIQDIHIILIIILEQSNVWWRRSKWRNFLMGNDTYCEITAIGKNQWQNQDILILLPKGIWFNWESHNFFYCCWWSCYRFCWKKRLYSWFFFCRVDIVSYLDE